MGGTCLVADLGLKYRIIVAKLRPQADQGGVKLMNSGPTLSIGATGHDVRRLQRIFVMTKVLAPEQYHGQPSTQRRNRPLKISSKAQV